MMKVNTVIIHNVSINFLIPGLQKNETQCYRLKHEVVQTLVPGHYLDLRSHLTSEVVA